MALAVIANLSWEKKPRLFSFQLLSRQIVTYQCEYSSKLKSKDLVFIGFMPNLITVPYHQVVEPKNYREKAHFTAVKIQYLHLHSVITLHLKHNKRLICASFKNPHPSTGHCFLFNKNGYCIVRLSG